jgi:hypothetical protein
MLHMKANGTFQQYLQNDIMSKIKKCILIRLLQWFFTRYQYAKFPFVIHTVHVYIYRPIG